MLIHATFAFHLNMVFNVAMDTNDTPHQDWQLIERLGGASEVARLLGYPEKGGAQRVHNWKFRGIPADVKLQRPDLFLPDLIDRVRASDDAQAPVGSVEDESKRKAGGGPARKTKEAKAA